MDFPLLKTFKVDLEIVDFLNQKYEQYSKNHSTILPEGSSFVTDTGQITNNLASWEDDEYQQFVVDVLLNDISNLLNLPKEKIDLYFQHLYDYKKGGYVKLHNHAHCEDFVVIIYLNTCSKGKTIFYFNEMGDKTKVEISPIKGNGVCFSSLVMHEAELTSESKRIFVAGVRVNL